MLGTIFHCESPDFLIRSIPDGDVFQVNRQCLEEGSDVFRDMFACCESGYVLDMLDEDTQTLSLNESTSTLNLLFQYLHAALDPYVRDPHAKPADFTRIRPNIPESAIPFPIIPRLISLADKYAFSEHLLHCLHSHLAAHASTYPLRVYGYAVESGLEQVAAEASMYLLHPPLHTYTLEDIKVIPTAEAYHKLVLLHEFRIRKLRELLMNTDIFPHGYGQCFKHADRTQTLWDERKQIVNREVEAATDVAAEMAKVQTHFGHCETCSRACTAAVSMLGYKCGKVPKTVNKLPCHD